MQISAGVSYLESASAVCYGSKVENGVIRPLFVDAIITADDDMIVGGAVQVADLRVRQVVLTTQKIERVTGTAEQLDTDWSIVSVAGMGAYWGGQTMNTVYDYVGYYNDKTTLYDFARQPDYVVIGLGTNDVSKAEENGKSEDSQEGWQGRS